MVVSVQVIDKSMAKYQVKKELDWQHQENKSVITLEIVNPIYKVEAILPQSKQTMVELL
jgi:hypothetical protein